ncbi:hypothetical protein D3C79_710820 [compost metagenome]
MFDRPCARISWSASINCSERADNERAIDRLVTSPSMPTATALGSKRRISSTSSKGSGLKGGSWPVNAGTRGTWPKNPGRSQASRLTKIRLINRLGQRGRQSLKPTPITTVARPRIKEGRSTSPAWLARSCTVFSAVAWLGRSMPSRLGSWPRAMTTAAPRVKPSTTEWETKLTSAPKRKSPSSN